MEGVSEAGKQSGEAATRPFRKIDTSPHFPHVAHIELSPNDSQEDSDPDDTILQVHPTRDLDETFDQENGTSTSSTRNRMSLIDGTYSL